MEHILALIATYGYVVVFLMVLAECAGLPVPGETSLLVAGALAGAGQLAIPGVIVAAALGAILGDTAGYWIGRKYGLTLIRRHGRLLRFDEAKLLKAQAFFARHGEKTVFLGRFVPVGRIFSAVLAGIGQMHYARFLAWNATGGLTWAALMGTLGYLFGDNLPLVEEVVQRFGLALLLLLVAGVLLRLAIARRAQLRARLLPRDARTK
jgi:membrane protein DedA with SNARE-associated domain